MAAEQRKLLEQLMGAEAIHGTGTPAQKMSITDPKVCRSYLVGTCFFDLFTNTKADKGPCPKVHSEALKAEYDAASEEQKEKWGFEFDCMRDIGKRIDECNRLIDEYEKRLEKTPEEIKQVAKLVEEIRDLEDNINCSNVEFRVMVENGQVSEGIIEAWRNRVRIDNLEKKKADLKAIQDTAGPSGHQKLQVCDVCGAYLSRLDNDRRLADHFYGKMHIGYAQMRKVHEELKNKLKGRQPPPAIHHDDGAPTGPRDREYGGHRGGGYRGGSRRSRRY